MIHQLSQIARIACFASLIFMLPASDAFAQGSSYWTGGLGAGNTDWFQPGTSNLNGNWSNPGSSLAAFVEFGYYGTGSFAPNQNGNALAQGGLFFRSGTFTLGSTISSTLSIGGLGLQNFTTSLQTITNPVSIQYGL